MPYTVHTLDGQAHTYPDPNSVRITDDGLLTLHKDVTHGEGYGYPPCGPLLAAYPPGQWTHYCVEPTPYETGTQANEDTGEARRWTKIQDDTIEAAHDRWKATYQQHLNAGRKAAEAQ